MPKGVQHKLSAAKAAAAQQGGVRLCLTTLGHAQQQHELVQKETHHVLLLLTP